MKTKFTKGPWIAVDYGSWFEIDSADGENIANSGGLELDHTGFNCCAESAANAHLIAVAPEMYEILSHMVEHDVINDPSIEREVKSLLTKARSE